MPANEPDLPRVLAGLDEAGRIARIHHVYWAADACADARRIITKPAPKED